MDTTSVEEGIDRRNIFQRNRLDPLDDLLSLLVHQSFHEQGGVGRKEEDSDRHAVFDVNHPVHVIVFTKQKGHYIPVLFSRVGHDVDQQIDSLLRGLRQIVQREIDLIVGQLTLLQHLSDRFSLRVGDTPQLIERKDAPLAALLGIGIKATRVCRLAVVLLHKLSLGKLRTVRLPVQRNHDRQHVDVLLLAEIRGLHLDEDGGDESHELRIALVALRNRAEELAIHLHCGGSVDLDQLTIGTAAEVAQGTLLPVQVRLVEVHRRVDDAGDETVIPSKWRQHVCTSLELPRRIR